MKTLSHDPNSEERLHQVLTIEYGQPPANLQAMAAAVRKHAAQKGQTLEQATEALIATWNANPSTIPQ